MPVYCLALLLQDGTMTQQQKMPRKKNRRHPLYPEPGAWVLGHTQGLPKIAPPKAPSPGNFSSQYILELVTYEGLGCCIWEYISPEQITDPKLKRLWMEAREALQAVVDHLEPEHATTIEGSRRTIRRKKQSTRPRRVTPLRGGKRSNA